MPPPHTSPSAMPPGRTGHACVQCRHRKQRCGGLSYGIKCRPCTARKVKCSFQDEVKDFRYNPYLQMRPARPSSINSDSRPIEDGSVASSSAPLPPTLTEFGGVEIQSQLSAVSPKELNGRQVNKELPREIDSLKLRIAEHERRLVTPTRDRDAYIHTPRPESGRLIHSMGLAPPYQTYQSPPVTFLGSLSNPDSHNTISSPQEGFITDGPLKALHSFRTQDSSEFEKHDPVTQSVLTEGEAYVIFRLYFTNCHPNAPFLDITYDSDVDRIRSNSVFLFISILSVGARFWGASSKASCWLHSRYTELIRLLDAELMRVTLRPSHDDHKLETVQALLLCAHWMPFDLVDHREKFRSRFSEGGAWQCLGLAIRWASYLALDRTCHVNFRHPETITRQNVQEFRTMLYLVESDHYLALSARRPLHLNPEPLREALANFVRCKYAQNTDIRLTSLFRVVNSAHATGCRPMTLESVEAFDKDVQLIEQQFLSSFDPRSIDGLSQHFPFISLRWYRLSYACAFLNVTDQTQRTGKVFEWAIEWSSQILLHLARPNSSRELNNNARLTLSEPDPGMVEIMSFTIDHHQVVIAYAAFFLVKSWLSNLVDADLNPYTGRSSETLNQDASRSLLFRLVDLAARILDAASPAIGHLARRYVPLLRGLTGLILSGNAQEQSGNSGADVGIQEANGMQAGSMQNNLGEDLWEMWQQAGLEPMIWPSLFDDLYVGP